MDSAHERQALVEELSATTELPFSVREYRERVERTAAALAQAGIDTLYATSPEAIYYLSGFRSDWYQAHTPASRLPITGVAVTRDGAMQQFVHSDELLLAEATTWGQELRTVGAEAPAEQIAAALQDNGWLTGPVGLELSSYRPSRSASDVLVGCLLASGASPPADVTSTLRAVMRRKSAQELAYHRIAARFGDIGLAAAGEALRAGATETEVVGEIVHAMSKVGAENPSITMPVFSGPKTAMLHSLVSRRRILPGDVVCVNVAGVYKRYHADAARTFFIGEPPDELVERVRASAQAFDLLAAEARVGRPMAEVLAVLREHYTTAGLIDDVWWMGGYELPASFPPDWVGEYSFDALDATEIVLLDRLVTNYESNFYLPDLQGVSLLIDTLLIDGDARLMHSTPRELIAIDC